MKSFKEWKQKMKSVSKPARGGTQRPVAESDEDNAQALEDFHLWMRGGREPLNIDKQNGGIIIESAFAYPYPAEIEEARVQAESGGSITWEEVQSREDRWEQASREHEISKGQPPRRGLCRVCRAIKLVQGDQFSTNKDIQFVPFGNATQITCRAQHCGICSCVFELITCNSSSIHPSFAAVHEDVAGTQLQPHMLPSGEVVLGVDYALRRVGAIRILSRFNVTDVIRQEHDISSSNLDPYGGNAITSTGPTRQTVSRARIREWLQECESTHGSACIDVALGLVRTEEMTILLIDVEERRLISATTKFKYFALSYVWGKDPLPVTLVNNVDSRRMENGLDVNTVPLPQTIEDAIGLVKGVGERYLWVDALCIVQDDSISKHQQIQRMDRIYSEAFATIVALSGETAASGLAGVRGGTRPPQQLHHIDDLSMVATPPPLKYVLKGSKLDSRAWTFQERMLSRRCIFFSPNNVYFQCGTQVLCEIGGDIVAAGEKSSLHINPLLSYISGNSGTSDRSLHAAGPDASTNVAVLSEHDDDEWETDDSNSSLESATAREARLATFTTHTTAGEGPKSRSGKQFNFELYDGLVRAYTTRKLSFVADIGNAFAGLVSVLEKSFGTKLVHGLPLDGLDIALLWTPVSSVSRRFIPIEDGTSTDRLFPSWSWMGWVGAVNFRIAKEEQDDYAVPEIGTIRVCGAESEPIVIKRRTWTKTETYKPSPLLQVIPDWVKRPASPPRNADQLGRSLPPLSSFPDIRSRLQFWAQVIPASKFRLRDEPPINLCLPSHGLSKSQQQVSRIMTSTGRHCGMLFHTPATEILNPPNVQRFFILLSRYKDGEERRMEMSTTAGGLMIWDHRFYGRAMVGNSLMNVLLVEKCEGDEGSIYTRVTVAQIHSKAWEEQEPSVEFVTLI